MLRTALDLVLLTVAAALVVTGLITYPHIPGSVLAAMIAAAALCVAPLGHRRQEVSA